MTKQTGKSNPKQKRPKRVKLRYRDVPSGCDLTQTNYSQHVINYVNLYGWTREKVEMVYGLSFQSMHFALLVDFNRKDMSNTNLCFRVYRRSTNDLAHNEPER